MKANIISLYAPTMQSGKTTAANRLVNEHGFTLVKFAGPLKQMTCSLLAGMGFYSETINRMVEGDLKEKSIPGFGSLTPRRIMQTLGTEWGRDAIEKDFWVKVALTKIDSIVKGGGRVVIDDMRFPNEYLALGKLPGIVMVYVDRPDAQAYADHPSEGLLKNHEFDVKLVNDETVEVFEKAVDFMVTAIG